VIEVPRSRTTILAGARVGAAVFIGLEAGLVVVLTTGIPIAALIGGFVALVVALVLLPRFGAATSGHDSSADVVQERQLFASDTPVLDLTATDYFGHRAFSEALATAIVGAEPPFTIALTGPWGSGKTSIAHHHLAHALDETARAAGESIAFIYFDVWKYEDALRRQLLREVALQLREQGWLAPTFDVDGELEDLEVETHETRIGRPRLSWAAFFIFLVRASSVGGLLAILLVIALLAFGGASANQLPDAIQKGLIALAAGAALSLARDFANTIQVNARQVTRKAADSADQFERRFADLIRRAKADRLVIVLDDLDRCEPETVVQMLNSIKAFLEPNFAESSSPDAKPPSAPIFVIPCDPDAIRNHLIASRESLRSDPDEYLRKFFNASIRITPTLDVEARTLVERELDQLELSNQMGDAEREGLISVVVSAFRRNPRRVKQFLNDVILKRLVLVRREDGGEINPRISDQVGFLAKLTAIEQEWRGAYQGIEQDERAYDQYNRAALGLPTQPFIGNLEESFADFLRATRTVQSATPGAFVRLKLTPDEVTVPLYYRFRESLLDGRIEDVRSVVSETSDPEAYRRVAGELLRSEALHHRLNTVLAIVDGLLRIGQLQDSRLATVTGETFESRPTLYDSLHLLAPAQLLEFLIRGKPESINSAVTHLILFANTSHYLALNASQQEAWGIDLGRGLAAIKSALSPAQIKLIRDVGESAAKVFREPFVPALAEAGAVDLVSDRAAAQLFTDLDPTQLQLPSEQMDAAAPVRLWLVYHAAAHDTAIDAFVTRSTQLLTSASSNPSVTWRGELIELLYRGRSALAKARDQACTDLAAQLSGQTNLFEAGRPRWEALSVLASLPCAAPADVTAGITQAIATDPVSTLTSVTEELLRGMPSDSLTTFGGAMVARAISLRPPDLEELLVHLIDLAPTLGWAYVSEALQGGVDANQLEAVATAIEVRRETLHKQQAAVIKATMERLIARSRQGSWPEWQRVYGILFRLADELDSNDQHSLIIGLGTWIGSGDAQSRNTAFATLQSGVVSGALSDEAQSSIAKHIVGTIEGRADPSWQPVLEWMVGVLNDGASDGGQKLGRTLVRMGDNGAWRSMAATLLASMHWPGPTALPIVLILIGWSRDAGEASDGPILRVARIIGERDKRTIAHKAVVKHLDSLNR
jgi:hypothetical protein